ncbi:MAG: hypothetical protein GY851_05385 [bacterium]|nr:hypothetical protein [bacterium]
MREGTATVDKWCIYLYKFIPGGDASHTCRGHVWPCHSRQANLIFVDGHGASLHPGSDEYGETSAGRDKHYYGHKP